MALPHTSITKIPNNEPDAVPALWNTRYEEIDDNFVALDGRIASKENEINTARNGKSSLDARLDDMESDIAVTSIDMQNASIAALKFALDQAAQANYGIKALKQQLQQEGEITITNSGIIVGCTLTKSVNAARNISMAEGRCFANGRRYPVDAGNNIASVPPNVGASSVTVFAYLYLDNSRWKLAIAAIGQAVPNGGIRIYNVTIPANSTDATDPYLGSVTMTDVRRIEPMFPMMIDSPTAISATLNTLSASDYRLTFDVITAVGAPCEARNIVVASRATNGFTLNLASAADNVVVRWSASKLNN